MKIFKAKPTSQFNSVVNKDIKDNNMKDNVDDSHGQSGARTLDLLAAQWSCGLILITIETPYSLFLVCLHISA